MSLPPVPAEGLHLRHGIHALLNFNVCGVDVGKNKRATVRCSKTPLDIPAVLNYFYFTESENVLNFRQEILVCGKVISILHIQEVLWTKFQVGGPSLKIDREEYFYLFIVVFLTHLE